MDTEKIRQRNNPKDLQGKNCKNVAKELDKNRLDSYNEREEILVVNMRQVSNPVLNPPTKMKILTTGFGKERSLFVYNEQPRFDFEQYSVEVMEGGDAVALKEFTENLSTEEIKTVTENAASAEDVEENVTKLAKKKGLNLPRWMYAAAAVALFAFATITYSSCTKSNDLDNSDPIEQTVDDFWDDADVASQEELDKKNAELDKKNAELDRRAKKDADKAIATIEEHLDSN